MEQIKYFLYLVLFFSLFNPEVLSGQKIWKLEDCIQYAFDNNLIIKQQVIAAEYNSNILKQSKIGLAPDLNAGSSSGISWGRTLDQTTYEFTENQRIMSLNMNATSSVTVFNGLQQLNTIRQNELNLMASLQDLERYKNDIALAIAAAYLQILFNTELLGIAENQLEITQLQVNRTQKLVEAGSLARGALLEIQALAASEELNVVSAKNLLDISYLNLTQILDLDSVGDFAIEIPEFGDLTGEGIIPTVNSVFNEAVGFLPQIKSAEYQLSGSARGLQIAKGARMPSLNLSTSFSTGYSDIRERRNPATGNMEPYPFPDQLEDNRSTTVSLSIRIPIFNGWMVNTNISNARLSVMNSRLTLETERNNLYKEIQQAYADATAAQKRYISTQQALVSMEESFMYTEQKFEVGLVNAVDYNAEKNRLTTTQSDLLQAKYDYIFKMKILDFYRGLPLTLNEL